MNTKRVAIAVLLAGTLVAVWFAPPASDQGVALSARTEARVSGAVKPSNIGGAESSRRTVPAQVDVLRIRPRELAEGESDDDAALFASTRWGASAPAAPVAVVPAQIVAPPPPQAPPLPFRVIGRYDEAGSAAVFLQLNDQNLVVRVGDTIGEQYKVESLEGNTLTLRYLPLNQSQSLDVGGAS